MKAFFTDKEKNAIIETEIVTLDNPECGSSEKEVTMDKLFLPAFEEMAAIPSDLMNGIMPSTDLVDNEVASIGYFEEAWWLRTPGTTAKSVMCVYNGAPDFEGLECYCEEIGIRPMMWIDADLL